MIRRPAFFALLFVLGAALPSPAAEPPAFYARTVAPFFEAPVEAPVEPAESPRADTFYYVAEGGTLYRFERTLSLGPPAAPDPSPAETPAETPAESSQQGEILQDRRLPSGLREKIVLVREPSSPIPGEFTALLDWSEERQRRVAVELPATLAARLQDTRVGSPPALSRRPLAGGRVRFEWMGSAEPGSRVWLTTLDGWDSLADAYRALLEPRGESAGETGGETGGEPAGETDSGASAPGKEAGDGREVADELYRQVATLNAKPEISGGETPPNPLAPPFFEQARRLRALLAERGIASSLALVNSRQLGAIETRSPDFRQFDLALLAIELGDEALWADFSVAGLELGQVGPRAGARQAFVFPSGGGWRFVKTPTGVDPRALALSERSRDEAEKSRVWRSSEDWWPSWQGLETRLGLSPQTTPEQDPAEQAAPLGNLIELGQRFGSLLRQNDPQGAFAILRDLALAARHDPEMALELSGSLLYLASLRPDLGSFIHEVAIILHRSLPPFASPQSAARSRLLLAVHLIDAGRAEEALEPLRDLLALKVGGELEQRGIHLLAVVALATGQGREQAAEKLAQALRTSFPSELRESAVYQLINLYHQLGLRRQEQRWLEREGFPASSGEGDLFAQAWRELRARFDLRILDFAEPSSLADARLAGKKLSVEELREGWLPPEKVKIAFLVAAEQQKPIAERARFLIAVLPDLRSLLPRQSTLHQLLEAIAGERRFPPDLRAAAAAGSAMNRRPPAVSLSLGSLRAKLLAGRVETQRPPLADEIFDVQRLESLRLEDCRELLLYDLATRELGLAGTPWWPGAFASCLEPSAESAALFKELAFAIATAEADDGAKALGLALLAAVLPNDAATWPSLIAGLTQRVDPGRMPQTRQIVHLLELARAMRRGETIDWQAERRRVDRSNFSLLAVWQEQILLRDRDLLAIRNYFAALPAEDLLSPFGLDRRLELARLLPELSQRQALAEAARRQIYILQLSSLANLSWSDGRTRIRLSQARGDGQGYPPSWFEALLAGTDNELGRTVLELADAEAHEDWAKAYDKARRLIELTGLDYDDQWHLGRAAYYLAGKDPGKKEEARKALRLFLDKAKDHPELKTARRLLAELGG